MRQTQVKSVAKSQQRACRAKTRPVKNIEVVTENVFVPVTVTKTFAKKPGSVRCTIPKRKVEVVKSNQINSNSNSTVVLPLLRKPHSVPEKGFLNATLKQIDEQNRKEKKSSTRLMYRNVNNSIKRSETFSEQSSKKDVLLFPSAISDLPLRSRKHRQESPSNKKTVSKSTKQEKSNKVVEKAPIKSPIIGDVKRVQSSNKGPKVRKEDSVIYRLRENFRRNIKDVSSASIVSSNASNFPTTYSTLTTTPSTVIRTPKKVSAERQSSFFPFNNFKQKVDTTPKTAISTTTVNYGDETKFPVRQIASNAYSQVRCTAFDLLTSDNFLETSDTDTIRDLNSKILPANTFQQRDKADYSILSFLKMNQPRYQDKNDCYPVRIKYSWQVLGTSAQTSRTLLESLIKENDHLEDETVHSCSVKYSWQIIGIATQTSRRDLAASKRHSLVSILSARTNKPREIKETNHRDTPIAIWRKGKRYIILNNQCTQTFAHKESQTVFTEFYQEFT